MAMSAGRETVSRRARPMNGLGEVDFTIRAAVFAYFLSTLSLMIQKY